jgi:hypothetical protein
MDDQRFDNLSRIIAHSTTRRATVKGIAAAIGGGVFASVFGVRAQRAGAQEPGQPGDPCGEGVECVTGNCSSAENGVCYCEDPARPWLGCDCDTGTEAPCGGGSLVCCATSNEPGGSGVCTSDSVGCNPTGECSSDPGEDCETDADCCTGTCSDEGVCFCSDPARPWIGCDCNTGTEGPCGGGTELCCPTGTEPGGPGVCTSSMAGCEVVCTSDPGGDCSSDDDCCTGTCSDEGVCFCSDPDRPWIGCPCTTGTEAPCDGGLCCPTGSEPGGPGVCTSSMAGCQTPGECTAIGAACATSDECCDELVCLDSGVCGIATTVVLPSTGSGMSNGSNLGAWIGATAAVGAAAAIAGRKLNPKSSEGSNEA